MDESRKTLEPVSVVISEIVRSGRVREYEEWVKGINQAVKEFDGFLGVDIIRPRDPDHLEYVVIVRFDTFAHLKKWQSSSTCQAWLEKSLDLVVREVHYPEARGLELWFTLPAKRYKQPQQPAYYKMVIVGIIAVYPLILILNIILSPLIHSLPHLLGLFISVTAISALLTYPVMPGLTRILGFWLYPSSKKKE